MAKTYRISVFNKTTERRELMLERYTSLKSAQNFADAMNKLDPKKIVDAKVIEHK